jgi:hypothetical protein
MNMQINKCNTVYTQKDKNHMIIFLDAERSPIANMTLNGGENPFHLKSGMRQWYLSPHTLLFNIVLEFLVRTIRQEEEIKGIQVGKEGSNYFYFQVI